MAAQILIPYEEYLELLKIKEEKKKQYSRKDAALSFIYGARGGVNSIGDKGFYIKDEAYKYLDWMDQNKEAGLQDNEFKNENFEIKK